MTNEVLIEQAVNKLERQLEQLAQDKIGQSHIAAPRNKSKLQYEYAGSWMSWAVFTPDGKTVRGYLNWYFEDHFLEELFTQSFSGLPVHVGPYSDVTLEQWQKDVEQYNRAHSA